MKRSLILPALLACGLAAAQTAGVRVSNGLQLGYPLREAIRQPECIHFGGGIYYEQHLSKRVAISSGIGWIRLRNQFVDNYPKGGFWYRHCDFVELPLELQLNCSDHPGRGWNGLLLFGYSYTKLVAGRPALVTGPGFLESRILSNDAFSTFFAGQFGRIGVEARRYFSNGRHLGIGLQLRAGTCVVHDESLPVNDICLSLKTGLRFGKPAAVKQ